MVDARSVPIDFHSLSRLLGGPDTVGHHRAGASAHKRDFEDVPHSGNITRFAIINPAYTAAEDRWARQERDEHSRQIQIEAELMGSVALRAAVEPPHGFADKAKL